MENKIIIKTGKIFYMIDKSEIDYIQSEGNYSRFYCGESSYLVTKSLSVLEERIDSEKFLRVNKKTIVNIEKIKMMKEINYNNHIVQLNNDKVFPWGRLYKRKLISLIKI